MQDSRSKSWDSAEERRRLMRAKEDPTEFGWFYEQYESEIRRSLQRLVRNQEVARDLTTETFVKALRGLGNYRWSGFRFGSYLHRIAANEAISFWRQHARRPTIELESAGPLIEPRPDALDGLVVAEQIALMLFEIEKLGSFDQEVLDLFYRQNISLPAIAEQMHKPLGTIKARLKRARRKLQRKLDEVNLPGAPEGAVVQPRKKEWLTWLLLRQRDGA